MHITTRLALTIATLIGIAGPVLASPATAAAETTRERGVVLECSGTLRGQQVHASVYENSAYGNVVSVVVGDPKRGGAAGSRHTEAGLWTGRTVDARVRVDGLRARITGPARRVGPRIAVHEELDDAGQHVVSDGFHRRLRNDLVLRYRRQQTPLTCETAFFYDLTVTRRDA
ncbi:hypothetical protein [Nocardioides sp. W7]|uniref:hypothetical protein n=1 Tax=Nocardioides sp. W7 TaxID=2931390 RepID=UPI001FD0C582|nr:hypothetical protein [Nocardioides sp. W7]